MTNPGKFSKSSTQYKSLLDTIIKEKLADRSSEYSKTDIEKILQDIWQNKKQEIIEIHAVMDLLGIDTPTRNSKEYKDIASIIELYTGMHILKQQKIREEQALLASKIAKHQLHARQSLESESLTAKEQALTDAKVQVKQDLVQFKQEQDLSQKAAKLEEILRINFGKTFADLVTANNERFAAINHPEQTRSPKQYTNKDKISRLLFDINKLQQAEFNKLCLELIDNHKTSHHEKKLIADLQAMVSPVFDIVATNGNLTTVYTNKWQKFAEVSNSAAFQNKLKHCEPSIRQKFLDICILVLSLGFVKPQNSADKFVTSTRKILSVSAQVNKILHGDQSSSVANAAHEKIRSIIC